jgi:hypothetical protein
MLVLTRGVRLVRNVLLLPPPCGVAPSTRNCCRILLERLSEKRRCSARRDSLSIYFKTT